METATLQVFSNDFLILYFSMILYVFWGDLWFFRTSYIGKSIEKQDMGAGFSKLGWPGRGEVTVWLNWPKPYENWKNKHFGGKTVGMTWEGQANVSTFLLFFLGVYCKRSWARRKFKIHDITCLDRNFEII